jgi:hypothetical protein
VVVAPLPDRGEGWVDSWAIPAYGADATPSRRITMNKVLVGTDTTASADPEAYLLGLSRRFPGVRTLTRMAEGDPAARICDVAAEEHVYVVDTRKPQ